MNLSVELAGVILKHPIYNASGPLCTTPQDLEGLANSQSSAVLTKSCTILPREGNPTPRYADFEGGSINSMGLPNLGVDTYLKILPSIKVPGKPVFVSSSGMSFEDQVEIVTRLSMSAELQAIELNLSCPNLVGKPQIGYDFDQSQKLIHAASKVCKHPLGVKLPPYFDFSHFQSMADILNEADIQYITCINSPGNGLVIDAETETTLIRPKNGFGGIGGPIIKPFGLSNVCKFRELLDPGIQIVGVGGIETGMDVFEYILAGADAVQVGTAYMQQGPEIFERLVRELTQVMTRKGYASLSQFRGKLKVA